MPTRKPSAWHLMAPMAPGPRAIIAAFGAGGPKALKVINLRHPPLRTFVIATLGRRGAETGRSKVQRAGGGMGAWAVISR